MGKIPQEWLENFSQEQIEKAVEITNKVLEVLENVDLININKINKNDLVVFVKKLDAIYYQYTGDEDAVGSGYKHKLDCLIGACEKIIDGIIKRDNLCSDDSHYEEVLSEKLICELCSSVVYYIFCVSQEIKD